MAPNKINTNKASPAKLPGNSPWPVALFKIVLTAAAIVGIALNVNLTDAWKHFENQNYGLLIAAGAIMLTQIVFGGLRWHLILCKLGAQTRAATSVKVFYISNFLNNWTWGTVGGDVLRVWLLRRARLGLPAALNSVILDRVASVAGVAILVMATAPVFALHTGRVVTAFILSGLAAVGLLAIVIAAYLHRLPLNWQHYRLLRGLHSLSSATREIFLYPGSFSAVLGLAIAAQILGALATYVASVGLNVGLSFIDCLTLMQPVALISALPISVGGWGIRETSMIGFLGLVGIPTSAALSLSVQIGLLGIVVTLPGAMFWLFHQDHQH